MQSRSPVPEQEKSQVRMKCFRPFQHWSQRPKNMPLALQSSWLLTWCLFSLGYEQGVLQSKCSKPQAQARLESDSGCWPLGQESSGRSEETLKLQKLCKKLLSLPNSGLNDVQKFCCRNGSCTVLKLYILILI